MMTEILSFLADNKTIVVGATMTIAECVVIVVNTIRKLRQPPAKVSLKDSPCKKSSENLFLWVINPINLFRPVE